MTLQQLYSIRDNAENKDLINKYITEWLDLGEQMLTAETENRRRYLRKKQREVERLIEIFGEAEQL